MELIFMCPLDGSDGTVRSILTNKGERQAVVCDTHGVIAWVGQGEVGGLRASGEVGSYNPGARALGDLQPGEYGYSPDGPFAGVWAARPPTPDAHVVVIATQYARFSTVPTTVYVKGKVTDYTEVASTFDVIVGSEAVPTTWATQVATTYTGTVATQMQVPGAEPGLTVSLPFTGRWKGRLDSGVWYAAVDLI